MDIVPKLVRSRIMAAVPQAHSKPEIAVRKAAHALGYRFRLHRRDLPGSPDIVFPSVKRAILVHGCFWHRHGCSRTTTPTSNCLFWEEKFKANRARDARVKRALRRAGWKVLIVWECQTRNLALLERKLRRFIG